jgi:hypothetical protein
MLKGSLAVLTVLLLAASAHAEELVLPAAPAAPVAPAVTVAPPPVALAPPPAAREATPPPPVASSPVPSAFMERFLSYDEDTEGVVQGRARQPLSRDAFYAELNRPDLVEKSRQAAQRRVLLAVAAGVVLAAGVTTAVIERVTLPNLNTGFCVQSLAIYNNICVPAEQRQDIIASTALVGGIALSALLSTLAYWSSPNVLSKDEASSLISEHNAGLLRRLRSGKAEFHVLPYASAQGGGVVTAVTF